MSATAATTITCTTSTCNRVHRSVPFSPQPARRALAFRRGASFFGNRLLICFIFCVLVIHLPDQDPTCHWSCAAICNHYSFDFGRHTCVSLCLCTCCDLRSRLHFTDCAKSRIFVPFIANVFSECDHLLHEQWHREGSEFGNSQRWCCLWIALRL